MDNRLVVNSVSPWQGYLHWVGNIREGVSKAGKAFAFADFTLKYQNHQMQESFITFTISGTDKVNQLKGISLGSPMKVFWLPDATEVESQDRWYPQYKAYNIMQIPLRATPPTPDPTSTPAQHAPAPMPSYQPTPGDLPF